MSGSDFKSLALVIAGALFGFFPSVSTLPAVYQAASILLLLISIAFLLLYGIGSLQEILHNYIKSRRLTQPFKIAILGDNGWNPSDTETWAWTDVSPSEWKAAIEDKSASEGLKVSIETSATVRAGFDRYAIVLNPYGSVYPERNLKNLETIDAIVDYVSDGGVFVNVADIPCYFAYSTELGRRLDTIRPIYVSTPVYDGVRIQPIRPFEQAPLPNQLGLQIVNLDSGLHGNLETVLGRGIDFVFRRAALVENNMESCIPPTELQSEPGTRKVSPIFFVKYGEGSFLISLAYINDQLHSNEQKTAMKEAIAALVVKRLRTDADRRGQSGQ